MANADHPRLVILKRLTALIEGASIAEGYDHDLVGHVVRGRTLLGDQDELPIISILESPRPDFGVFTENGTQRIETWDILIQGWALDDPRNPTDPLYSLLADVEARLVRIGANQPHGGGGLYPGDFLLGVDDEGRTLLSGIQIQPGVIRPANSSPEQPVAKACFLLPIRLGLAGPVSNR